MSRSAGTRAEQRAERALSRKGLQTVCRNYHCRWGEIDLVMIDEPCLVFVEVRCRKSGALVTAQESITRAKKLRLIKTGQHFLMTQRKLGERPVRFDVVAISGSDSDNRIDWLRDAFRP